MLKPIVPFKKFVLIALFKECAPRLCEYESFILIKSMQSMSYSIIMSIINDRLLEGECKEQMNPAMGEREAKQLP